MNPDGARPNALKLLLIGVLTAQSACGALACARDLWIEHVTIVSPERAQPLRNATVHIHDGQIREISTRAAGAGEVIDGHGLYLAPGLIDSHVHLGFIAGMTAEQEVQHPELASAARIQIPRSYLYFGFTTLIDLISTPQAMAIWNAHTPRPDTYFCGGAAIMDGYPMQWMPKPDRYRLMPYFLAEPGMLPALPPGINPADHTPEAVVRRMKADGALCVKTFFERGFGADHDLPVPRLETIRAVVRAAHAAGLPVLMHANGSEAQEFALAAGIDIIAHGLWNWREPLNVTETTPEVRKILDAVIESHRGWQPTVQVLYGLRGLFDPSFLAEPMLKRVVPASLIEWYGTKDGQWFHDEIVRDVPPSARADFAERVYGALIARDENAVRYLVQHNARILFGTDTPSSPTYANPPGLNGWLEMQRLLHAGMSPAQIFRAATLSNAQAMNLHDLGTVQTGKRANLLLLREDPTQTIQAYAEIVSVILNGEVLDRDTLAANSQNISKNSSQN